MYQRRLLRRSAVPREELEARLCLHDTTLKQLLRAVSDRADRAVADALADVVRWLTEDRERLMVDLFVERYPRSPAAELGAESITPIEPADETPV